MTRPLGQVPFDTVLIANRGEIAVRIARTLRRIGIRSVAVFSEADREARHVIEADSAVLIGPPPARESYLDIERVVAAAHSAGAQAIHPGYGFLSENAAFAAACKAAGLAFIGPPAASITAMGDKISAKTTVAKAGVAVVPGLARPGLTDQDLIDAAGEVGYPVLIKPSAGGGGKGMRMVEEPGALASAITSARRESAAAFGDDTLFIERFVSRPRHIEVQVLADQHGQMIHLGERECSLQRRHQKVVEEAPSPLLDHATRSRIGESACRTAASVDYVGAGTVEFIVSADRPDEFFFMEMNTRLQVEHPVTEMVTGIDLVEWQIRVAQGEPLGFGQSDISMTGHAIEARVYAEDPGAGFLPTGGRVVALHEPHASGIRVDSGLLVGTTVGSFYDPMLSKVIAHGVDRAEALARLDHALQSTSIAGLVTNIDFVRFLLRDPDVVAGRLDTSLLDRRAVDYRSQAMPPSALVAVAAHCWYRLGAPAEPGLDDPRLNDPWDDRSGWRLSGRASVEFLLDVDDSRHEVALVGMPTRTSVVIDGVDSGWAEVSRDRDALSVLMQDQLERYSVVAGDGDDLWVTGSVGTWRVRPGHRTSERSGAVDGGDLVVRSPMPGTVIAIAVVDGDHVESGAPVVVVEAMKMEHAVKASTSGEVEILVSVGDQVTLDQPLARVTAS